MLVLGLSMANTEMRDSDPIADYADLLDAAMLLRRWVQKYPDTDLGLKTLAWLARKDLRGSILRETN